MVSQRTVALIAAGAAMLAVGCAKDNGDGMTPAQTSKVEARDSMITKSDGKWDNLSAEEKSQVMKEYGTTDEAEAKKYFERTAQGENTPTPQPGPPGGSAGR